MAWAVLTADPMKKDRAERARRNATANRLRFDFWYGEKYGPIHYDLERVTLR